MTISFSLLPPWHFHTMLEMNGSLLFSEMDHWLLETGGYVILTYPGNVWHCIVPIQPVSDVHTEMTTR